MLRPSRTALRLFAALGDSSRNLRVLPANVVGAGTPVEPLFGPALAADRPVPWRALQWSHRRSRAAEHVLFRCGWWRRVEVGKLGPHVDAHLRFTADRVDRRNCSGAVELERALRRHRRSGHAFADFLRQRSLQIHGCGQDVDARRPRQHAPDRPYPCRSAESGSRLRRRARPRVRRESRPRRVSFQGWRRNLAVDPAQERRHRRDRPRLRSAEFAHDLRDAVEHSPSSVEHLCAVLRPRQRNIQVHRRRR